MQLVFNWNALLLFALVVLVIRPLGVFLSTYNSTLKLNEKLFISWVGPRGIVAAGIASLFGTKLMQQGVSGAEYITPLVFMIVLGTVLLNATTARLFAKFVGVFLKDSEAIVIIGASEASRVIAKYLMKNDRRVVLLDRNKNYIAEAKNDGIEAFDVDIFHDSIDEKVELNDVGYLIAMTASDDVNNYAINQLSDLYGEKGAFRLISSQEVKQNDTSSNGVLLTKFDDYINLNDSARDYPVINELVVASSEDYKEKLQKINQELKSIPLFVKMGDSYEVISTVKSEEVKEKDVIIYLGKKLNI